MSDVLSDLFFGRISPFEDITEKTSGTQELFHAYVEARDAFERTLTEEQRQMLDALITQRLELETAYAEEAFKTGFRTAVRLIFTAFQPLPGTS